MTFFLSLFFLVGVQAAELSEADIRARVESAISQRHPDQTPEFWTSLGPKAPVVIIAMFYETQREVHRTRLLQALAWYKDPAAIAFLKGQVETPESASLKNKAIRTLALAQGEGATEVLAKQLQDSNPSARHAAAQALHLIQSKTNGPSPARDALEKYRPTEKETWIVRSLEHKEKDAPDVVGTPTPTVKGPPFIGKWSGYWLVFDAGEAKMKSNPVTLSIQSGAKTPVPMQGSFKVTTQSGKEENYDVEQIQMTGNRAWGSLVSTSGTLKSGTLSGRTAVGGRPSGKEQIFIKHRNWTGTEQMLLEIPGLGATLVVHRSQ